jgi:hypothetical protein
VIRLGLRLTLAGGREAATRLVLIVIAVAIGVALLLATLAGLNAVQKQNARYAWLETGYTGSDAPAITSPAGASSDPLWWRLRADYFHGRRRRHGTVLAGPTRHRETARAGPVLRLAGPEQAAEPNAGRAARRPVPRHSGRHDRAGGTAGSQLADRHRR